uniref:Uncharacterized protein n=1 Tax=Tanacetum cinerariifolium TaxID=118510 RepID=A0A6L2M7S3_TANCI|nr:hypothetical protein [Tanacetum cinerariifolium]
MIAPGIHPEKDIAMLYKDDDFSDDDSEGFEEEKLWKVNKEWLMAPVTPPSVPAVQPLSVYEVGVIEALSTRLGNLEYGHGHLVKKVIQVGDAEVAASVSIGKIGPMVFAIEGQVQVMASQMVQAVDIWEQVGAQVEQGQQTATQRDEEISILTQQVQALQAAV